MEVTVTIHLSTVVLFLEIIVFFSVIFGSQLFNIVLEWIQLYSESLRAYSVIILLLLEMTIGDTLGLTLDSSQSIAVNELSEVENIEDQIIERVPTYELKDIKRLDHHQVSSLSAIIQDQSILNLACNTIDEIHNIVEEDFHEIADSYHHNRVKKYEYDFIDSSNIEQRTNVLVDKNNATLPKKSVYPSPLHKQQNISQSSFCESPININTPFELQTYQLLTDLSVDHLPLECNEIEEDLPTEIDGDIHKVR